MTTAIYCRLSEDDRNKPEDMDSESIQNQKNLLTRYAADRGWDIYDIYSDGDYTGADRNRPQFNKLLADARDGKFGIVLCKTQSRFTREMEIVEKYIHGLFPLWGIRFVSVVDNADTDVKGNKKSRQINGLVNEWYLEDLSDNIKSVLTNKRKQGRYIGSTALYGYKKDPDRKGCLIIDGEAAETVREVFELFDRGYGKNAIARLLNGRGVPNPTEYKRLKGIAYKTPPHKSGTLWKYPAIADMLANEMYIGRMVQGKYESVSYKSKKSRPVPRERWIIAENTHEPIISAELWERVQIKLRAKYKPAAAQNAGVFAGKVLCAGCGRVMRSGKNGAARYLECATKHSAKGACPGAFITREKLAAIVEGRLSAFMVQYADKTALKSVAPAARPPTDTLGHLKDDVCLYESKISGFTAAVSAAYFDKAKGVIDDDEFAAITKEAREQKHVYADLLRDARAVLESREKSADNPAPDEFGNDKQRRVTEEFLNNTKLNRVIADKFIDHIVVGKNDRAAKRQPVDIYWNF